MQIISKVCILKIEWVLSLSNGNVDDRKSSRASEKVCFLCTCNCSTVFFCLWCTHEGSVGSEERIMREERNKRALRYGTWNNMCTIIKGRKHGLVTYICNEWKRKSCVTTDLRSYTRFRVWKDIYWYINNLSVVYVERKWWMSGGENDLIIKICSGRINNIVL